MKKSPYKQFKEKMKAEKLERARNAARLNYPVDVRIDLAKRLNSQAMQSDEATEGDETDTTKISVVHN